VISSIPSFDLVSAIHLACATCTGIDGHGTTIAANWAIIFMVACLTPILGGFIGLILTLKRREAAALAAAATDASASTSEAV